jgi:primosomal replication protein N
LNRVRLQARLLAIDAVRHTPAGIPVCTAVARFEGTVVEAGIERQLEFEVPLHLAGHRVAGFAKLPLGTNLQIDGFLAPRSKRSGSLILHVSEYETVTDTKESE